ncbi:hypothetical protein H0H87_003576 [Tephrocybe sp. NHM501043]|nr:hypothetical protein H0H87_003576 [Tephrocybe sp. NHM501043]
MRFVALTSEYLSKIKVSPIHTEKFAEEECFLRLASPGHVSYEDDDIRFFKSIDNEEQYMVLMQDYVLRTVSESLRIIGGHASGSAAASALQFVRASHLRPAHHARWDILAIPGTLERPYPFLVFFVPPSEFGVEDIFDFSVEREVGIQTLYDFYSALTRTT